MDKKEEEVYKRQIQLYNEQKNLRPSAEKIVLSFFFGIVLSNREQRRRQTLGERRVLGEEPDSQDEFEEQEGKRQRV